MALFDFIEQAGERLADERKADNERREASAHEAARAQADHEASMSEALRAHVADLGLEVDDVDIAFRSGGISGGGTVTLLGGVPDAETHEKLLVAVGNVAGVARVDDQLQVPEAPEPQLYTVKKGDTLSKIAAQFYGKGGLYRRIFEANKPMLKDPNKIYPGQVLRIPPKPE